MNLIWLKMSVYAYLNSKTVIKDTIKALKSADGSITTNGLDIANSLNEYFFSVFLKDDSLEDVSFPNKCENVCKDPNFEVDDVREQLMNLNVNKSVGVDKVHPHVLKECSDSLSRPLSLIFKKSFYSGVIPDEWLVANITPLFKKGNKLEPTNYRPVSLTSIVCKIMEKIIRAVMMDHLTDNNLLAKEQHGFVNGKSCCSNLLEALDFITRAYAAGIDIDIIFLDFAKAFDSVSLIKLCLKLYGYGFRAHILDWCRAFLSTRKQRVVLGEFISEWLNVTSGVPQGSVLGPLLFVIFINDLMINILNKLELFADDTKMMSQILNEISCKNLQDDLNKLLEWSDEWSIKFNEEKCKVMHIGKSNPQFEYKMNGHILQETEIERDLGVIISKDLEWDHHIISATNKANRKLGMIKHSFNYLDVTTLKLLYKSMVRPHLEYAATVWSPSWIKDIDRLEDVQRRATRIEQLRGLNYEERRRKLKLPTLEERRRRGDLIEMFKIKNSPNYINFVEPLRYFNNISRNRHNKSIHREVVKTGRVRCRHNFLTIRVVEDWNSLTQEAIDSTNKNLFKNRIDKILNFT